MAGFALLIPVAMLPQTFDPFLLPKQLALLSLAALLLVQITRTGFSLPHSRTATWALAAVEIAEVLAFAGASDRLGAILGNFGYRLGITTHVALGVVFLFTMSNVRDERDVLWLLRFGLVSAGLVTAYGLLQFAGGDPFDWTAKSSAVFSTIGNPNDLAGYAVLSVGSLGALMTLPRRFRYACLGIALTGLAATVVLSQSRSGVAGLVVALIALPVLAAANRWPTEQVRRLSITLGGVVAGAILVGLVSGEAGLLRDRFARTFADSRTETSSVSTRVDIWRGSLAVFGEHPLFGVGQDGLLVNFNRERPPDLGPPFSQSSPTGYDPLVNSPHSFPIEVLVTLGVAGALSVLVLFAWLGRTFWCVLRARHSETLPFLGAAGAGYLVVAGLNPLSLPSLAQAAVFSGIVAALAMTEPRTAALRAQRWRRVSFAGAASLFTAVCLFSVMHLWADRQAFAAAEAAANMDDASAVRHAGNAARLIPFESAYRRQKVQALANQGSSRGDPALVRKALQEQTRFLREFPGLASDFIALARLQVALGEPGAVASLAAARDASPYGINTASDIANVTSMLPPR